MTSVAFNPDGTRIATGCADGTVRVWDTRTGLALVELSGHAGTYNPEVISVAFTPDGTQIVTASHNEVFVWDARIAKEVPDEEEIAYRRVVTAPNFGRYRKGYLAARAAKDDFAAKFYLDRLIEFHTTRNQPDEAEIWRAERAKRTDVAPPPREKK